MYSEMTSCAFTFEVGEKYIMNTSRYDGVLHAPGSCSLFPTEEQAVARYGESVPATGEHESLPVCMTEEGQVECKCVAAKGRAGPGSWLAFAILIGAARRRRTNQKRVSE